MRRFRQAVGSVPVAPSAARSERLLRSAIDLAGQTLRARRVSVMLVDAASHELWVKRWRSDAGPVPTRRSRVGQGVAGYVAETGQPLVLRNIAEHPRFRHSARPTYRTPSLISVPVVIGGQVRAVLNASDKLDGASFDDRDLAFMTALAQHVGLCLGYGLFERRIRAAATTDPLTGLYNRRYFERRLAREASRARRASADLSLVMLDLNEFKTFNDSYGHARGDALLIQVSSLLRRIVGERGVTCRYGGDEFALILPNRTRSEADAIAREIENAIASYRFEGPDLFGAHLTVSAGIAALASRAQKARDLVATADDAMYRRKWQLILPTRDRLGQRRPWPYAPSTWVTRVQGPRSPAAGA